MAQSGVQGVIDREAREKELLEYLRVYVMIWQKIDFIWGMFLTSYIPLFGFLHFYQGDLGAVSPECSCWPSPFSPM
ncbi:hypothetical protein KU6B_37220 [Mameliella alba]|uniref:hypothetical protein n=1 Tax=Mameliella alba TaxID=561184 RepID=UPI0013E47990|nr:hypothetical protein [Mameliella alba]BBU57457.1 hypothetical protein KU6B_37220 [Mameliella alba]